MKRLFLSLSVAVSLPGCGPSIVPWQAGRTPGPESALRARELKQWLLGFDSVESMEACVLAAPSLGLTVNKVLRPLRILVVTPGLPIRTFQAQASKIPGIAFVERDAVTPDLDPPGTPASVAALPSLIDEGDPGRSEQWYLERMRLPQA